MSTMDDVKVYCFSGFVKHASLVNKVYPTQPGEEGARGSDLAYLVFYAKHRPEKLAKVGRYLHKHYGWDAAKDRRGYHRVTLEILDALIDSCHEQLSYFAANTIQILSEMAELGDSVLLTHITATLIKFNAHYDGALDTDPVFAPLFHALLDRFCDYAMPRSGSSGGANPASHQTALAGLEAIKSVAFSRFVFASSKSEKYAAKIVPPIMANIRPGAPGSGSGAATTAATTGAPANGSAPSSPPHSPQRTEAAAAAAAAARDDAEYAALQAQRRVSIYDDLVHDDELSHIALQSLQRLVRSATATTIANVILPVFGYLDANAKWADTPYTTLVMRAITAVSSTIVLGQILTRLNTPAFQHKARLLAVLPQTRLSTPCLAISLTDVVDCLLRNSAEHPVPAQKALAWLTAAFTHPPTAARDALATMVPKLDQPSQLSAVLGVLEAHADRAGAEPPSTDPFALDTLEPLFPLLARTDDASRDIRARTATLIARAAPTLRPAPLTLLAVYLPRIADATVARQIVAHHWAAHPVEAARLVRGAARGEYPPALARAAIDAVRPRVPALATLAVFAPEGEGLEGENVDLDAIAAAMAGRPATAGTATTFATAQTSRDLDAAESEAAASVSVAELPKHQSVLRFASLERKATTDEFRAILNGKPVLERPISMGPGWSVPADDDVDDVLDKI
ncbi:membrane anchoring protein efr3a [Blastocladiella emersonii ATCC 22665]|nr:membrane anchoring protein efr3a [Blastocladiella emersonii ATCC 22665]